jgi:nitronate monooxygenase
VARIEIASAVGWPADVGGRTIRNEFFDRWHGRETELTVDEEAIATFRHAPQERDCATMPVYIGQGVGMLDGDRPSVAEVVERFAGAATLRREAARLVAPV